MPSIRARRQREAMPGLDKHPSQAPLVPTDTVLAAQGVYYALTGIWALLHIGSFQWVTGPKVDTWLVKTVGALVLVSGTVMAASGFRRRSLPEIRALALGSAIAFTLIDTIYVAKRRISLVYLLDAALELAFAVALLSGRPTATHAGTAISRKVANDAEHPQRP